MCSILVLFAGWQNKNSIKFELPFLFSSCTAVSSGTSTMEYYGSFIYQDGTLDRVLTSEGYYLVSNGKYHYNLKDHLGSTHMVVSYSGSTPTVEQSIK